MEAAIPATTPVRAVRVLRRQLGLRAVIAIIFFTVSGGAFGLEPLVGESGKGMALLLILVTPIIWALPAALMVAELSTAMPVEGGYIIWVREGLGRFWGWNEGWWSWLTSFVDMAIYPVLFADYLAFYVPEVGESQLLHWLVAVVVIWTLGVLNMLSVKGVGDLSTAIFAFIIPPFLIFGIVGIAKIFSAETAPWNPFVPEGQGVVASFSVGLFVVMWNYLGWDGLSTVANEIENPRKTYTRALAITVPLITAGYLIPVLGGLAGTPDYQGWTDGSFPDIAKSVLGEGGFASTIGGWIAIGGLLSAAGLFSAILLGITRVPSTMAADGWLPGVIARKSPRFGTPIVAIVISCAIYSMFSLSAFSTLVVVDVFVYSLALMLEFAALIALRIKRPNMPRPYRVPGGWFVIILITLLPLAVLILAVYSTVQDEGISALWLSFGAGATGPLLYPFVKRFIKRDKPDFEPPGLEEAEPEGSPA